MKKPEPESDPVTRSQGGTILWCREPVALDHFAAIRKYCDDCLGSASEPATYALTTDFELLEALLLELDAQIPWFSPEEEAEAMDRIPEGPRPYVKPGSRKLKILSKEEVAKQTAAEERQREHLDILPEYRRRYELWKRLEAIRTKFGVRKHAVDRLLNTIRRARENEGLPGFEILNWEILPQGESLWPAIHSCLEQHSRQRSLEFDVERIRKVVSLKPLRAYRGTGDFSGYLVFLFTEDRAVLECPMVGNAVYLLSGNWRVLSRLSKAELLSLHSFHARRVIHREGDGWLAEVTRFAQGKC